VRILGIDLAVQPKSTGVVVLDHRDGTIPTFRVDSDGSDPHLVDLARDADFVAIDCPLGWPSAFVQLVADHHSSKPWSEPDHPRAFRMRTTDRVVADGLGPTPLSVSADKLGATAVRCARLQVALAASWGEPAARDGSGKLVEVYPAAALRVWLPGPLRYKGKDNAKARMHIIDFIAGQLPAWIDEPARAASIDSDHVLDALISALVGLAAARGFTTRPSEAEREIALLEGWIDVPTEPLERLLQPASSATAKPSA
jgi:predicted nuclease with RNAse H fold